MSDARDCGCPPGGFTTPCHMGERCPRALRQPLSALIYEAPRDLTEPLKVRGVGRVQDEPRAMLVLLSERPTDDEIRSLHDFLREWRP